jgi:hypothetical protein
MQQIPATTEGQCNKFPQQTHGVSSSIIQMHHPQNSRIHLCQITCSDYESVKARGKASNRKASS